MHTLFYFLFLGFLIPLVLGLHLVRWTIANLPRVWRKSTLSINQGTPALPKDAFQNHPHDR